MESHMYDNNVPLRFYRGDENGVVIEKGKYDTSIFRNQYAQALKLINELASRKDENHDASRPNIIAFCGNRGEGKTSCMMTVQEIVEHADAEMIKTLIEEDLSIDFTKIEFLKMIEPAFFDKEHNILELVVGQLFQNFKECERTRKRERRIDETKQREVLGLFNKVKKCATLLETGQTNLYDSIEELDELAASMTLRECMDKLLTSYLEYSEHDTLAIVIDDMDYNWHEAYDMTKLMSKYLSGKNCFIMVSVSIKQLVEVTKTSFVNDLQHQDDSISFDTIAAKYINKLIPLHYRVEMPRILDLCNRKLEIARYGASEDEDPLKFESVKQAVVQLIFEKTRYLYYNSVLNVSLIVPDDLRSLRHLLGLLLSMEDYDKNSLDDKVKNRNLENKRLFQSYLYNTWSQQLRKEDQAFVQKLAYNDQSTVNKMVVQYLKNKVDIGTAETSYYKEILSSANYAYNISIGDVFYVLNYIERNAVDRDSKLLVFFLKSFYSIMMYTYYDMISENMETLHPKKKVGDTQIYKFDSWFYTTNYMQGIVNGSYFTYQPMEILRTTILGEDVPSDLLCMDGEQFNQFLIDLKTDKTKYDSNQLGFNKQDFEKRFRMAELFILFINRRTYSEGMAEAVIERERPNPYFVESFGTDVTHYVFDILAPFVNLINVKFTYDRYSELFEGMYEYARNNNWSLLRKLMRKATDKQVPEGENELDFQEKRLASDAVLRNAEIMTMIKERLESMDNVILTGDDGTMLIASFYKKMLENLDVKTYEMVNGGPKKIEYKFLDVIAEELKENDGAKFKDLLMSYTENTIKAKRTQQGPIQE